MSESTPGQRRLLRAIYDFSRAHGKAPTVRELMIELGVTSTNSISCLIASACGRGLLGREKRISRSLRLTSAGRRAIGAPCCICPECKCACHAGTALPKTAAQVMRNLRAGPADGESLEAFALRLQILVRDTKHQGGVDDQRHGR